MNQNKWVILVGQAEDGSWSIHIPEINHDRQVAHMAEVKAAARQLVATLAGVDTADVTALFHNVSPGDNLHDGGGDPA